MLGGAKLDEIEATIINPAPVDEEYKSVLWLFADGLLGRRRGDATLIERELVS
jgi:hypothetical protein